MKRAATALVGVSIALASFSSFAFAAEEVEAADKIVPLPVPLPQYPNPSLDGALDTNNDVGPSIPSRPQIDPDGPIPEVKYALDELPRPVRRMRELIVEACKSGDIEQLRALIGVGANITELSLGGVVDDPISYLLGLSGDKKGHEILAILLEVLEAGYVQVNPGEPEEIYVWPYFFALPLEDLTDQQRVELYKIVTAGDYEDMKIFGAYIFYRVGITPEGRWAFFVSGD